MRIRDRIKELRRVRASDLLPNPKNWRQHPTAQLDTLRGVLSEIGWADAALARETPDGLQPIDGHTRCDVAPDVEIPCLILDVTEDEADKVLATRDPLAAMAEMNAEALNDLLASISTQSEALQEMLEGLRVDTFDVSPAEFPTLPTGDKTTICTMMFSVTTDQRETIEEALKPPRMRSRSWTPATETAMGTPYGGWPRCILPTVNPNFFRLCRACCGRRCWEQRSCDEAEAGRHCNL